MKLLSLSACLVATASIAAAPSFLAPTAPATPSGEAAAPLLLQDAPAKPVKVSGKVVDKKGEPMDDVMILLYKINIGAEAGGGGPGRRAMSFDGQTTPATETYRGRYGKPIAMQKADSDGKFTFAKVAQGSYRYEVTRPRLKRPLKAGSFRVKDDGKAVELEIKVSK